MEIGCMYHDDFYIIFAIMKKYTTFVNHGKLILFFAINALF